MKEDLSRDLHVDEIATYMNISPSRLRCLFKLETGHSPIQYLKYLRMVKAKDLVENTFLNVKQIMCEVGIKDESHFVRDFKRTFGVTITQYRRICDHNFDGTGEAVPRLNELANK
jgi:transcriptional regulator GlxA family with amidase domain